MTTPQTTPELLACPFCSGTDLTTEQPGLDHTRRVVKCQTCGAKGPPSSIEQRSDLLAFTAVPEAQTRWNERAASARVTAAPQEGVSDPMDWPLPCDITVGHGTMRKGVALRSLVLRMKSLYEMATGQNADEVANRAPVERQALWDKSPLNLENFRFGGRFTQKLTPEAQALSDQLDQQDATESSQPARFQHTFCQSCGKDCGPGDDGPIDCGGHAKVAAALAVGVEPTEPLTTKEIADLTAMVWGAPVAGNDLKVAEFVIRAYEALKSGERPKDPVDGGRFLEVPGAFGEGT